MAQLDDTREGWAEELVSQFAGFDAAQQVVQDRERNKPSGPAMFQGRPVYGMQGAVLLDGGQVR